jgi:hypothetical protein
LEALLSQEQIQELAEPAQVSSARREELMTEQIAFSLVEQ